MNAEGGIWHAERCFQLKTQPQDLSDLTWGPLPTPHPPFLQSQVQGRTSSEVPLSNHQGPLEVFQRAGSLVFSLWHLGKKINSQEIWGMTPSEKPHHKKPLGFFFLGGGHVYHVWCAFMHVYSHVCDYTYIKIHLHAYAYSLLHFFSTLLSEAGSHLNLKLAGISSLASQWHESPF